MTASADRVARLAESLSAVLDRERGIQHDLIVAALDAVRDAQASSADVRWRLVAARLEDLCSRVDRTATLARDDYLTKISSEVDALRDEAARGRGARVLDALRAAPRTLNGICEALVDQLIQATSAERGFVMFFVPEAAEADVFAARNFETTNLALEEYDFSRTVLRRVLGGGEGVTIKDASNDPAYASQASIQKYNLRSILAAPMRHGRRTIGAVYLEHNSLPAAFDAGDAAMADSAISFAVFVLESTGLLPIVLDRASRVVLDANLAASEIVSRDPVMLDLISTIQRIADSPATVLITGESGTGKELVARALHFQANGRAGPFVPINCAAIPDNLLESELFGFERGAFTGAVDRFVGRIEHGARGTVFFDEIGELALPLQAKLLRVLESNELQRLGGRETIRVDARFVAATSKDLRAMIGERRFHEALYYRLNVIPLDLPPLRDRPGDIPLLIDHFLNAYRSVYGRDVAVEPIVYTALAEYSFPGNVRELENIVHRLVALARDGVASSHDLPDDVFAIAAHRVTLECDPIAERRAAPPRDLAELRWRRTEVRRLLARQERELAERAVREADGNVTLAAERLGIHRVTLHKLIRGDRDE